MSQQHSLHFSPHFMPSTGPISLLHAWLAQGFDIVQHGYRLIPLLILWALLAGGTAYAQPDRPYRNDAGDYDILQATYGAGRQAMDVTMRVRQWVEAGRGFRVSNEAFGADPAPQQPKMLRIEARGPDGRSRYFDYPESQWVDARLFRSDPALPSRHPGSGSGSGSGWSHNEAGSLLQATYGTRWQSIDVTFRLSQLLEQGERGFVVSNDVFGADPAPGHRKVLNVQMRDRSGRLQSLDFPESGWVDAAQLAGAGRGAGRDGRWQDDNVQNHSRTLVIHRATYGDGSRQVDVTERLRQAVAQGSLDIFVSNGLAGYDPAPHVRKRLQVEYSVGGNRWTRQVVVPESQRLRLP